MENNLPHIIEEARKGIPQAQSRLMNLYWNDVKGFLLYKVNDENSAEELTVETFTKAISKLELYNEDFNFKTWLLSIAQNNLIDFYRKKNRNNEVFSDDYELIMTEIEPSPEEILIDEQNYKNFQTKLELLDPKYTEIIQLRFFEDLSIKEIAEKLQLSESNVKVRIMRARKLLADAYKNGS